MNEGKRERNRKVLLSFPVSVTGHLTDEKASDDKPDTFTVSFEALQNVPTALKIGLEPAKAMVKIKALDDSIKALFPNGHEFVVQITERWEAYPETQQESTPTTLDKHTEETHEETVAENIEANKECDVCGLSLAECTCEKPLRLTEKSNEGTIVELQKECPECGLPLVLCTCTQGDGATTPIADENAEKKDDIPLQEEIKQPEPEENPDKIAEEEAEAKATEEPKSRKHRERKLLEGNTLIEEGTE